MKKGLSKALFVVLFLTAALPQSGRAEAILQYFGTTWAEITERMPELAEAGWTALWLPPPFKAGSQFSVGFDTFDRFDMGSKNQMGGVATRHGTEAELIEMMKTAHRFGIRVYFDNVMAHNGGPIPGYDENTSIKAQPGFYPEDFHLMTTEDGYYRKMPEWPDWNDEWQVLNRNPFGLDIAQEDPNTSFGAYEGSTFPKYHGIRHPDNPEYYLDTDLPIATNGLGETVYTFANNEPFEDTGYGPSNTGAGNGIFDWDDTNGNGQHDSGETSEPFTDTGLDPNRPGWQNAAHGYGDGIYNMGNPVSEDVNTMLFRAIRWFIDTAHVDGFRLDAVKHVPNYFFGKMDDPKDEYNWGYNGQIQEQFNISRGYSDWNNHRDSVFNTGQGRDDAMLFGEHLGAPPSKDGYVNSGMRIADNDLYNGLKYAVAGYGSLAGYDQPGYATYGVNEAVMYAGSHDFNYISLYDRPSAHALLLTRAGLPIIYTDGYNEAQYPDANGKYFPQHGDNPFLGQFGDNHLLNLLTINQLFARGDQIPKWSDADYVAYERWDQRESPTSDGNAVILAYMMARNGSGGASRSWTTTFPEGARLYNYSQYGGGFYVNVSGGQIKDDGGSNPIVPEGGFFAFSWRVPEMPAVWGNDITNEVRPIMIFENGAPVGTMLHTRTDGYSGDPAFNPYDVSDSVTNDYQYDLPIPRITDGSNLTFIARADGSAENIMMKLDGGMDVNSHMGLGPLTGDLRDKPPALSYDMYLGYEQMLFVHRVAEKFAAVNISRNVIGSGGSETYEATIGTSGFTVNNGSGVDTDNGTVDWVYHDPANSNETSSLQFSPAPENAAGSNITLWVKIGYTNQPQKAYLYYTTDGTTYPEGSAGVGKGTTQVIELFFDSNGTPDGGGTPEWWKGTLPALSSGTVLRYKIGVSRLDAFSIFPFGANDITLKKPMETLFTITNFNAETAVYRPHNDYGTEQTGLEEGYHVLRTKAFLNRGGAASLYNLNVQTFYYDTQRPEGEIVYPGNDGDTLGSSTYGVVARTDRSVEEVWYRITDSDAGNDDSATGVTQGNGAWVQALPIDATLSIDSDYEKEWRFDYNNIPSSGTGTIEVRLKEASSSTNNALNDVNGHFTTLTRTVNTSGPDYRLFVAYPQSDGEVVGPDYVAKIHFSKSLASGLSSNELLDAFTLNIDSNFQSRSDFSINWDVSPDYHALAFTMDNYFNDIPSYQHTLEVEYERDGYPALSGRRIFLSWPVVDPYVNIVNPPIADEQGDPFRIVLPDVAAPVATQRQYTVYVETDTDAQDVAIVFEQGSGTVTADAGNPETNSNYLGWNFTWDFPLTNDPVQVEGTFRLRANVDTDGNTNTVEASALRETRVLLRETVNVSTNDVDDDDDGISDFDEVTPKALPTTSAPNWINSDVHVWQVYGQTDPQMPDTDGDGLPDGLESGWRLPADSNATLVATDTDGDGWPNFISDLDPPFYNTWDNYGKVPAVSTYSAGNKTDLKAGTMTDPTNPDSDYDGLPDGLEDANRNGWVDGDGEPIPADWDPWIDRDWPDGSLDISDTWTETDPNNADTDQDGLSDGHGEDTNANGVIDGDTDGDRTYDTGEAWTETDPLNPDTDADGLPDGWEAAYGLNPLDSGTDDLGTAAAADGDPAQGPAGDPDSDTINNLQELINGTNPKVADSGEPPPSPSIVIGPQAVITVGAVSNAQEFSDWKDEDLIALDPYDNLESTSGGDVYYRPWASDGLEWSRDLIAFYAQDGGVVTNGGDGNFYFRVDLFDLEAYAEDSGLDIYVVIDTGNTAVGERKLIDNIDALTDMRWEAVVAVYDSDNGAVCVNIPGSADTDTLTDTIVYSPTDVDRRTQAHANGFKQAYFNSELDAVEFSISRQALIDAGWNGNFDSLNFQVFTTRDGTDGGDGELDGPDIADSIRTDWIAEDYSGMTGSDVDQKRYDARIATDTLVQWVGVNADNNRGQQIKILPLIHGNQHILPGNVIQDQINDGEGAGYYRPLDTHEAFDVPVTMHITPTLASAIEWARADTNSPAWRDGPTLNARIASLIAGDVIDLTGSTFADHLMPYFTPDFNADNVALATEFLNKIYGSGAVSDHVFWTPERVLDDDVLSKIQTLGFDYTFIDQSQHLYRWFGIDEVNGDRAYRINRINNINCIPISDKQNDFRFASHDGGAALSFRKALSRRVRSGSWGGQHPQVMTLLMNWQEFGNPSDADGYDRLIRWMSSKGWIKIVSADQIAENEIDVSMPPDGIGDVWNREERGTGLTLEKTGHDWIQYSSQGDYDNWYVGSAYNQGLLNHQFDVRPGTPVPDAYGMLYTGGIVSNAWAKVSGITTSNTLGKLARATIHASTFETAFHQQTHDPIDMTKFSSGEFVYPDTTYDEMEGFARFAQSQTRMAAIYGRVDQWAAAPPASATAQAQDIDLDGIDEYLLYNGSIFAVFERSGGRMTAAWVRNPNDGDVFQMAGNPVSYAGSETEEEGSINVSGSDVAAYRTSCLKDWFADDGGTGTSQYVNELYSVSNAPSGTGWQFTSADGKITKTIMLADTAVAFDISYTVGGGINTLYVRNGLSPNLLDLLENGQQNLGEVTVDGSAVSLANSESGGPVAAALTLGTNSGYSSAAVDDDGAGFHTVNMRNQAQTQQIELYGSGTFSFSLGLGISGVDSDGDGVPDDFELQVGFMDPDSSSDGSADEDSDGVDNAGEYIAGTGLSDSGEFPRIDSILNALSGMEIQFPTKNGRKYYIWYNNDSLIAPTWTLATPVPMSGNNAVQTWIDDGSQTAPPPDDPGLTNRFYQIEIQYP